MKTFLKRLFCNHYWIKGYMYQVVPFKWRYECTKCGKEKFFTHDPVNPL